MLPFPTAEEPSLSPVVPKPSSPCQCDVTLPTVPWHLQDIKVIAYSALYHVLYLRVTSKKSLDFHLL